MVLFCKERKVKGTEVLSITLQVQPRARKTEIVGVHGESLKVKVAAQPIDGEANEELIRFFSKFLEVPKANLAIRVGGQSKHKILDVEGVSASELTQLLIKNKLLTISIG
jgi:uncharacterized protein (TIGR00251 family)